MWLLNPVHRSTLTLRPPITTSAAMGIIRPLAHGSTWMAAFRLRALVHFPLPFPLKDPAKLRILSSIEDSQHRYWYKLADTPNVYYCVDGGSTDQIYGHCCRRFRCVLKTAWVTYGQRIQPDTAGSGRMDTPLPLSGFSTPFVYRMLEDRRGTLWIGTAKEGLCRPESPNDSQCISIQMARN